MVDFGDRAAKILEPEHPGEVEKRPRYRRDTEALDVLEPDLPWMVDPNAGTAPTLARLAYMDRLGFNRYRLVTPPSSLVAQGSVIARVQQCALQLPEKADRRMSHRENTGMDRVKPSARDQPRDRGVGDTEGAKLTAGNHASLPLGEPSDPNCPELCPGGGPGSGQFGHASIVRGTGALNKTQV
jgi:hypothetical protein